MFLPMKTTTIRFITAVTAQGQQPEPANFASGFNKIREDTLRADLTFVTSDALQARMSLQNGDEMAIQWIASECHSDTTGFGAYTTGYVASIPAVGILAVKAKLAHLCVPAPEPSIAWAV
jgi:hypothetical protein